MDENFSTLSVKGDENDRYERFLQTNGYPLVAGLDEVGRGPLAGPVVAACVILPASCDHSLFIDSKKLSAKKRLHLHHVVKKIQAHVGIGIVDEATIETINILQASLLAMKQAVDDVSSRNCQPDFLLIDGKFPIPHPLPQRPLIRGESKSGSIAAASIVAKVVRDGMMEELHKQYPVYNFYKNKGYPTKEHRMAISRFGPCPVHRKTFRGVKEFL